MIDEAVINNWFTYHSPSADQVPKYEAIRAHAREFAHVINNLVPDSADKTTALRTLREAVMWANAAIATELPNPPAASVADAKFAEAAQTLPSATPYQTSVGFTSPYGKASESPARHSAPETLESAVEQFMTTRKVGA